eukprot:RCo013632
MWHWNNPADGLWYMYNIETQAELSQAAKRGRRLVRIVVDGMAVTVDLVKLRHTLHGEGQRPMEGAVRYVAAPRSSRFDNSSRPRSDPGVEDLVLPSEARDPPPRRGTYPIVPPATLTAANDPFRPSGPRPAVPSDGAAVILDGSQPLFSVSEFEIFA